MAQRTDTGSASADPAGQPLPDLLHPDNRARREKLLKDEGVDVSKYDRAEVSVKNIVLDCLVMTRKAQTQVAPEDFEAAFFILIDTQQPLPYAKASQHLARLLARCECHGIRNLKNGTAWELALLNVQRDVGSDVSANEMRVVDCFLHLEIANKTPPVEFRRHGDIGRWDATACGQPEVPPSSYDWIELRHQNLPDVLYMMKTMTNKVYHPSVRQRFTRRVVQHFYERQASHDGTNLLFRDPRFEVDDEMDQDHKFSQLPVWSLSMPYFTTDTYRSLGTRAKQLRQWRLCQARRLCQNSHLPLTLDEYCKPSLGDRLAFRNEDQVLSKHTRTDPRPHMDSSVLPNGADTEAEEEKALNESSLLVVRQAWLWMINDFVITACPHAYQEYPKLPDIDWPNTANREDLPVFEFYRLRMRIGVFLSDLIGLPNDQQAIKDSQTFFDAFQDSIVAISEDVSQYLKLQDPGQRGRKGSEYFDIKSFNVMKEARFSLHMGDIREELAMIESVLAQQEEIWKRTMQTIFPEHWKDGRFVAPFKPPWHDRKLEKPGYRDTDSQVVSPPMLSEHETQGTASMALIHIPEQQIAGTTSGLPPTSHNNEGPQTKLDDERGSPKAKKRNPLVGPKFIETWRKIERPQAQFEQYKRRIAQLNNDAARVEASVASFLDLRAKHASMQEAHSTAVMSAAIFGFTLVTIIFTPLSFMLSLFALPIQRLQDHQVMSQWGGENAPGVYKTNYVGKFMATAEIVTVAVTILAMYAAVQVGLRKKGVKKMKKWWHHLRDPLVALSRKAVLKTADSTKAGDGTTTETKSSGEQGAGSHTSESTTTSGGNNHTTSQPPDRQEKSLPDAVNAVGQPDFSGNAKQPSLPKSPNQTSPSNSDSRRAPFDVEKQ